MPFQKGHIGYSYFKGKHLSTGHKLKLAEALKGPKSPRWRGGKVGCNCLTCGKEFYCFPATIKKGEGKFCSRKCWGIWKSINIKGENNPAWKGGKVKRVCKICGKEFKISPYMVKENKGKFCSFRCSGIWNCKHMKKRDTSIEILIEQELIKSKIPYIKQCPIEGISLVDFLLPDKIIIQCDGDYWHSLPGKKNKDANQDLILSFKGYRVFRFTETEIKKSASKCLVTITTVNPVAK